MFWNHLKSSLRIVLRRPGFTFLNVFGLVLGFTCFTLILIFVGHELSYDRFHPAGDRLFRVTIHNEMTDTHAANTMADVAHLLEADFPAVEEVLRLQRVAARNVVIEAGDNRFNEAGFILAEESLLDVFGFRLESGNPTTALEQPNSVLLTHESANRHFGTPDVVGRTFQVLDASGEEGGVTYTVTGILADPPAPTHLEFNMIGSYSTLGPVGVLEGGSPFAGGSGWTYVRLTEGTDVAEFEKKVDQRFDSYTGHRVLESVLGHMSIELQRVSDIHLGSKAENDIHQTGDLRYVYMFGIVALLILGVACVNYMNLATSIAHDRAREIGVRKTVGAHRGQIRRQILTESLVLMAAAVALTVVVVESVLPAFSSFTGQQLSLDYRLLFIGLPSIGLIAAILAGLYPAFYLSSFRPVSMLKAGSSASYRKGSIWKFLVVGQFGVSIMLIAGTIAISRQLDFLIEKDLGYDRENILSILLEDENLVEQRSAFQARIEEVPGVSSASIASDTPIDMRFGAASELEIDGRSVQAHQLYLEFHALQTLGIEFRDGRPPSDGAYPPGSALVNRSFVDALGWEDAVGRTIPGPFRSDVTIVGVTEDFHYYSLYEEILPAVMTETDMFMNTILVRLKEGDPTDTIDRIETLWQEFVPYRDFEFRFLDAAYNTQYRNEQRMLSLFRLFTSLAVIIACLGIFGLATYMARRRRREIGIRKTFGASVASITGLLAGGFARIVGIAFLLAAPITWILLEKWLSRFAYRIDPDPLLFLQTGGVAVFLALVAVGGQAVRAALANPVDSLRTE